MCDKNNTNILLNKKLSQEQIKVLKISIEKGVPNEYLELFGTPDFHPQSMSVLTKLSFDFELDVFTCLANKYLTTRKIQYMGDFIKENKPSIEYVKLMTNSKLSMSQISLLLRELKKGIDLILFEKVTNPDLSISQIAKLLSNR